MQKQTASFHPKLKRTRAEWTPAMRAAAGRRMKKQWQRARAADAEAKLGDLASKSTEEPATEPVAAVPPPSLPSEYKSNGHRPIDLVLGMTAEQLNDELTIAK